MLDYHLPKRQNYCEILPSRKLVVSFPPLLFFHILLGETE